MIDFAKVARISSAVHSIILSAAIPMFALNSNARQPLSSRPNTRPTRAGNVTSPQATNRLSKRSRPSFAPCTSSAPP